MVRQSGAALALVILTTLAAPLLAPRQAAAQRRDVLKVRKKAMRPTRLPGFGGQIFVSVQVSKRNHDIQSVRAQARISGQAGGEVVTLTQSGNAYSGTINVPANQENRAVKGSVYLYVTTNRGPEPNFFLASVSVDPAANTLPPPPPRD